MELLEDTDCRFNALTKRDLERQTNLKKRRDDKNLLSAENEKLEIFEKVFEEKVNDIQDMLEQSPNIPKSELPDYFNTVSKKILTLQKYVAASNIFLRNYDIQKCHKSLQELTVQSKILEEQLIPKKKFGFKNKMKVKITNNNINSHNIDEVDASSYKLVTLETNQNQCGFTDKFSEVLNLNGDEIFKKDVTLERLENCTVFLKGSPSTLHLDHLKNCKVFSGPVSTSIFAEKCIDCTLVISCQQLRLHSSKNVHIYLHVTSRAIMEDCLEIAVAPYNWSYTSLKSDFQKANLDLAINNWKSVDDFNWLNIEKQSPNWRQLQDYEQVKNWDT